MTAVGDARKRQQEAQAPLSQPIPSPVDSGAIGRLNERRTVVALLACLPMHEDGTGHVADCGFDLDTMPTCGCVSLPGRLAAIVREHTDRALAGAWDEGFTFADRLWQGSEYSEVTWAPDLTANPYRAARQEAAEHVTSACICPTDDYCPRCHPRWHANWSAARQERGR